jgi:PKD repeat protein
MKKLYLLGFFFLCLFLFSKAQFPYCTAQFSFSVSGNTVTVTPANAVVDSVSQHLWNFGDGYTSTSAVISHTYNQCGTYFITHQFLGMDSASNPCVDSVMMAVNISCGNPCNIQAHFTSHLDSLQPLSITFVNTSVTDPANTLVFTWDFGDGSMGTSTGLSSITHQYNAIGFYTVCLYATSNNSSCSDTLCYTIFVQDTLPAVCNMVAAFVADTSMQSNSVAFFNQSTSNVTINSYVWNFGDGNLSDLANPTHVYNSAGSYTVCLTIESSSLNGAPPCTSTYCQVVNIIDTINCNVPASFVWLQDSTHIGTVVFNSTSTGMDTTTLVMWDFGDGSTFSGLNAIHTFAHSGTYLVCMTQTTSNGCVSNSCISIDVTVDNPAPCNLVASFDALPAPNTNNVFVFSNTSLNCDPNSLITWSFGDGTSATGNNISHSYNQPGNYLVCMQVAMSNTCFSDTCIYLSVNNPSPCNLDASFSVAASPTATNTYLFTASNNDPSAVLTWNFNDSSFATGQIVQHIFSAPGSYAVCLTVSLAGCIADTCITVSVDTAVITPQPSNVLITYPNPAQNQLSFDINSTQNQTMVATIYNLQNIMVFQYSMSLTSGNQTISLPLGNLPPGMYVLKLNYGGQVSATLFQKM